jgi:hypothetical protein
MCSVRSTRSLVLQDFNEGPFRPYTGPGRAARDKPPCVPALHRPPCLTCPPEPQRPTSAKRAERQGLACHAKPALPCGLWAVEYTERLPWVCPPAAGPFARALAARRLAWLLLRSRHPYAGATLQVRPPSAQPLAAHAHFGSTALQEALTPLRPSLRTSSCPDCPRCAPPSAPQEALPVLLAAADDPSPAVAQHGLAGLHAGAVEAVAAGVRCGAGRGGEGGRMVWA